MVRARRQAAVQVGLATCGSHHTYAKTDLLCVCLLCRLQLPLLGRLEKLLVGHNGLGGLRGGMQLPILRCSLVAATVRN
jgi:hypothetical protein